jgi:hypothetical protein
MRFSPEESGERKAKGDEQEAMLSSESRHLGGPRSAQKVYLRRSFEDLAKITSDRYLHSGEEPSCNWTKTMLNDMMAWELQLLLHVPTVSAARRKIQVPTGVQQ